MVEFLKDIEQEDGEFTFKAGKWYPSQEHPEDADRILIRQPNSPKHSNYWSSFPKTAEGVMFRTVKQTEMTAQEIESENKVFR